MVDFVGFSGCLGLGFGVSGEGLGVVYWVYVYTVLGWFMQGLCSVCSLLYIHRGNGKADFLPFICSGFWLAAGRLVGCWWFAAAAGGGGVWWSGGLNLKESRSFKLGESP